MGREVHLTEVKQSCTLIVEGKWGSRQGDGDMATMKAKVMGTTKFGWCLDDLHDECWVTNGEQVCSCPCHGKEV